MSKLTTEKRAAIVRALVEGNSIRATVRLTGAAKATVLKLLVELGEFCSIYQDHRLRDLKSTRIEADEIHAFVGAKSRNGTRDDQGDIWTYTCIDRDSKLMLSWLVGPRSQENFTAFMMDVADRLAGRVQLTTDGNPMYISAVRAAFDYATVDYAQIVKSYGQGPDAGPSRKYSPMVCTAIAKVRMIGRPNMDDVSTSFVERANLSMRMGMRRFTRLTNGFSKKAENHAHAVSLFFFHYNFCRPRQTLTKAAGGVKTTPAMAAGVTDRIWTVEDMLKLMKPETMIG